jgi:hypothetical protein
VNARSLPRILALAVAALALPLAASALEQKTLLASDGTLYTVRAGTLRELAASGYSPVSNDFVIQWSARTQSGGTYGGTIPGTSGGSIKKNLQLAYDEMTGSPLLLWTEQVSVLNVLHLGVLRGSEWRVSDLLPNLGFPHAYNPQMVLTHQTIHYIDSSGNDATRVRPILSILWWEEANSMQARYAPIFLDDDSGASDIQVYDLPVTIGSGPGLSDNGAPAAAYQFPAIRVDGSNGELAASFADLDSGKQRVVRITFPDHLGDPSASNNITWQRRRIPVVGVAFEGPIAGGGTVPRELAITTIIGPTYRPTLVWSDGRSIGYARTDGTAWSAPRSIPITPELPYDRAMRLVEEMANRN